MTTAVVGMFVGAIFGIYAGRQTNGNIFWVIAASFIGGLLVGQIEILMRNLL